MLMWFHRPNACHCLEQIRYASGSHLVQIHMQGIPFKHPETALSCVPKWDQRRWGRSTHTRVHQTWIEMPVERHP